MSIKGIVLRLHPEESDYPAWYGDEHGPPPRPCFVARGTHTYEDVEYDAEAYQFYYRVKSSINLGGVARRFSALGSHKDDVETVIVLFDKESQEPKYVYFKAHGLGQGTWRKWEECEKSSDEFLVAYVALGSHAMYPTGQTVRRLLGLANDRLSEQGPTVTIPQTSFVSAKAHSLANGIAIQDTIPKISDKSNTSGERQFLPSVMRRIRRSEKVEASLRPYSMRPSQTRLHRTRLPLRTHKYVRTRLHGVANKPSLVFF